MAGQAQVVRWGNSLAVRIPKNIAEEARLAEGDKLVLEVESPGHLAIKAVDRPSLAQLVSEITAENLHQENSWGGPVGGEVW